MLFTREAVSLGIALLTFFAGMAVFIWKTSATVANIQATLKQTISEVRYDAELNRVKQTALDDLLKYGIDSCKESIDLWEDLLKAAVLGCTDQVGHARSKVEEQIDDLKPRLNDVEQFLIKTTSFERRR
jgi:hypothetical protein